MTFETDYIMNLGGYVRHFVSTLTDTKTLGGVVTSGGIIVPYTLDPDCKLEQ